MARLSASLPQLESGTVIDGWTLRTAWILPSLNQPFFRTIASIQIGAKGDVQPFETGSSR